MLEDKSYNSGEAPRLCPIKFHLRRLNLRCFSIKASAAHPSNDAARVVCDLESTAIGSFDEMEIVIAVHADQYQMVRELQYLCGPRTMHTTVTNVEVKEQDMSQTISLRLPDELADRLDRFARLLGNGMTRTRAGVLLLDEALREEEFTGIEFRNTFIGRQPFVKQSGMAVWEFIMVARDFDDDAERTATYLECPLDNVKIALNYYRAFRDEIDQAIADNDVGEERLQRLFPNLRVLTVPKQDQQS
jgi:hypothetical protein